MKACQTAFCCLIWASSLCAFYMVNASDEDLMDFDFSDLKEIDWNYDTNNSTETLAKATTSIDDNWRGGKGHGHGVMTLDDDDMSENQVHPFDWREKILRNALSKALRDKDLRQKFVEVMPILRVLSKQQRLALSALISAQVNAKKDQELKLEQVRMMFGDDKKLLIPIVYDIARLVSNAARKYLQLNNDLLPTAQHQQRHQPKLNAINRRKLDLDAAEEELEESDVGTLPSEAMLNVETAAITDDSLEDFIGEIPDDTLDAQSINEALQASAEKSKTQPHAKHTSTAKVMRSLHYKRARRAANAKEFVHKLIRSIPLSVNEEDLQKGAAGRTVKLNTTSFVLPVNGDELQPQQVASSPTTTTALSNENNNNNNNGGAQILSYQEIEDLAFASLNGTEIQLAGTAEAESATDTVAANSEPLPSPEELIAGPRYRINNNKMRIIRPKLPPLVAKRKRVQVQQSRPYIHPKGVLNAVGGNALVPAPHKCERFTSSMCIRTDDYPLDQIMGSIRRHKNAMTALLAEFYDKPLNNLDLPDKFEDFDYNKRRREDENDASGGSSTAGSMCQSIVRYARPQKARSASGEWKYIVNTGQHTQTLRLEKCSNPQESCSYLAQNYRSHCAQVYNYHRLLSWDRTRGLHVDIFKVPTCCSCQIDGYRQQFPPLDTIKAKDFTPAYSPEPYSTINEELDYNDDEAEDDLGFQYSHKYHQQIKDKSRHAYGNHATNELQLGSQTVRSKVQAQSPALGSYLTPPGSNEYDTNYALKSHGHQHHHQHHPHPHRTAVTASVTTSTKNAYNHQTRRRPYKSLSHDFDGGESRADLDLSPSETQTDKEVNIYGKENTRQVEQQKRKRIYSVPHTATTSSSSSGGETSPVILHSGINTSSVQPSGHGSGYQGHGHGHNGYYGHDEHDQIFPGHSSTTTTHQTSATSPSYYTPGARQNVIRSGSGNYGRSKPRYRGGSTAVTQSPHAPQTQRTAYAYASTPPASSSSSSATSVYTASLPTTNDNAQQLTPTSAPADDAFPSIYHISSIFNNSVPIGGTKRINYSYHPIIDFFENASKRTATATKTTASLSTLTTVNSSGQLDSGTRTTFGANDQIISHKIPKYSSVINKKLPENAVSTAVDVNGLLQYRERRIGVVDDGGASGGGGGKGFNVQSNTAANDVRTSASSEDSVWHPMVVM